MGWIASLDVAGHPRSGLDVAFGISLDGMYARNFEGIDAEF